MTAQHPIVPDTPDDDDPPLDLAMKIRVALSYAVLAPSSHNSQPWRFIVDEDSVMLCADRSRALPVIDPYDRELFVSCGAALFNLRVALSHLGLAYTIALFPSNADPDVIAFVRIVDNGYLDMGLLPLFNALTERVTTRAAFAADPLAPDVLQSFIEAGIAEGVEVACVAADERRAQIAALVAQADRIQFADSRFRRELASWIHPLRRGDGMPAYAAGVPALLDFATPLVASVVRTFDLGGGMAATHQHLVAGSPLVVGLATLRDDPPAWVAAGQGLERLLLTAVTRGLTASFLNQPVEVDALREPLRVLLRCNGVPQLMLRVGRGPRVPHAPRRPLQAVMS